MLVVFAVSCLAADTSIRDISSQHVQLHTDLSLSESHKLLDQLEATLALASDLFGESLKQPIECYAILDCDHWPAATFSPEVRAKIMRHAGVTITDVTRREETIVSARATVYAFAGNGTPQHEIMHAYLGQRFGVTGPVWFAEGIAEVGQYDTDAKAGVTCSERICKYLHELSALSADDVTHAKAESGDSWQAYAERWALCHLLLRHPAYQDKFREYARSVARGTEGPLEKVFAAEWKGIESDFAKFCHEVKPGYHAEQTFSPLSK
jgi:hypothetical protein